MKKLVLILFLLPVNAHSTCMGRVINNWVNAIPQAALLRDAADGRWQAGGEIDAWSLNCDPFHGGFQPVVTLGPYDTWDLDKTVNHFGVHIGLPVAFLTETISHYTYIPDPLALLAQLANKWKPLKYANVLTSVDGFAGYRPILTGDLRHHFVYGFGLRLSLLWGAQQTIDAVNAGQ